MGEYEKLLPLYFDRLKKDFNISNNQFGLIVLFVRTDEEGGTDLATNLTDESVMGALEDILKTMRKRRGG